MACGSLGGGESQVVRKLLFVHGGHGRLGYEAESNTCCV